MALTSIPSFPILVIDTASTKTHVGLGATDGSWSWYASPNESGTALFRGIYSCLAGHQLALGSIRTVIFCEGPGSMLGIRTAAMAIRTWTTTKALKETIILAYSSLALATEGIRSGAGPQPFAVAIDARRKSWYRLSSRRSSGSFPEIQRVPAGEMDSFAPQVFHPKGFPVWNQRPEKWRECPYEPTLLENSDVRSAILRPVGQPDAFIIDPPVYHRWTPTISRPATPTTVEEGVDR